jgi:hypothetical protein
MPYNSACRNKKYFSILKLSDRNILKEAIYSFTYDCILIIHKKAIGIRTNQSIPGRTFQGQINLPLFIFRKMKKVPICDFCNRPLRLRLTTDHFSSFIFSNDFYYFLVILLLSARLRPSTNFQPWKDEPHRQSRIWLERLVGLYRK